ncbi:ATP-dependent DNA helicase [Pseudogemmobacter bohemicus]|uniref:ATP-dependent DNA helicase n=1 Tax=Pseudogemmobacter bohemicus TaxID=2250708 RepID=UPI000DD415BC|nr:DEAD/DEAH box helicase [Pseudogemmobacter bohemicus]
MRDLTDEALDSRFAGLLLINERLFKSAIDAERLATSEPDLASMRLRGLCEGIVEELYAYIGLSLTETATQFERLQVLKEDGYAPPAILTRFHAIRLLGNKAAHNGAVSVQQALDLLEDAATICPWLCRLLLPDLDWSKPLNMLVRATAGLRSGPHGENIVAFPAERVLRVSDQAARLSEEIDPHIPPMRSKLALADAFDRPLNEDQTRAIAALDAFLRDDNANVFLLCGYAGTGKTFLASGLTQYFLAQGRQFSLAAPTGRAAQIIAGKTGQAAGTLHRLIYDYKDIAYEDGEADQTYKIIAKVAVNATAINSVTLVDEASLIADVYTESEFFRSGSGFLLRDLVRFMGLNAAGTGRKLIFLGDPAQLPPVGMDTSPALDMSYLREHFQAEVTGYTLTEVVRQKADSSILKNILPLRESLESDQFSRLSFDYDDDVLLLGTDQVAGLYLKIREHRGVDAPMIVTWTNAEAALFNRTIRARLFPGRETVCAGDQVIAASNTFSNGRMLANGEFFRIKSAEPVIERRSVPLKRRNIESGEVETIDVALSFRDVSLSPVNPAEDDMAFGVKILDGFLHGPDGSPDPDLLRALYVDFATRHKDLDRRRYPDEFLQVLKSDPYFNALRLKFGYAVTCHKAQGGEWSHVFVKAPWRGDPRNRDNFRWLYTAMTRASGKLYMVDPPEPIVGVLGPGWTKERPDAPPTETVIPDGSAASPTRDVSAPQRSPESLFKEALHDRVTTCLQESDITIEDIAYYPYRAAFYFKHGAVEERVDISWKGNFTVSAFTPTHPGRLWEMLQPLLAPITGKKPAVVSEPSRIQPPGRPFLRSLHDSFTDALAKRGICVSGLTEYDWNLRYELARGEDPVTIDIWFDGRDRIKRFTPVRPDRNPSTSLIALQQDVEEILASEVQL